MIHSTYRSTRLTRSRALQVAVVSVLASACLEAGPTGAASSAGADPGWGPVQELPTPDERVHVVAFADGTLAAVWHSATADGLAQVERSTRPVGGSWTPAERFPVAHFADLGDVAAGPDGALHVSYSRPTGSGDVFEVRTWHLDGTVGPVTLSNTSDGYDLHADDAGDVVAARTVRTVRTVRNRGPVGSEHRLRHLDGTSWRVLPTIDAELRDIVLPGPGDSVWLVSYERPGNTLRVRRWQPGAASWEVEWERGYPPGHPNDPYVAGMDFALGRAGHAVLAFYERPVGSSPGTVRVVRRAGRSGWTRADVLQRVSLGSNEVVTGPVAAAVGSRAEVAWTTPAQWGTRRRAVRLASLDAGRSPQVRRLAAVRAFRGHWDVSLDVAVRPGGDVLTTYVERQVDRRDLVAWLGPHGDPVRATLVEGVSDPWSPLTSVLVPGLAAVVARVDHGRRVSRVWES